MKILLIGNATRLGADILRTSQDQEIFAPDQIILDVRSRDKIDATIRDYRPDVVINVVSMHDVLGCEDDPASAFAVNCVAVRDLARASSRAAAWFVTLSTDYVFGGDKQASCLEDDKPSPLQIYGISRLAGEYAALSAAPDSTIIVRSCGLYGMPAERGREEDNFVDQRVRDARARGSFEMGSDQIVSPTYIRDLSAALLRLIEHPRRAPGIYHLVNEGKCSWFEFTKAIFDILGMTVRIKPVDRSGTGGDLRRPLYSALANTRARELGIVLPSWRSGLERYLQERYVTGP